MTVQPAEHFSRQPPSDIDFFDTEVAFSSRSDEELRRMRWLFRAMSSPRLVRWGAPLMLWAARRRFSWLEPIIRRTIFSQFVGGTTLLDCAANIERLAQYGVLTILDYGAEGKETEVDFNRTMNENLRAIDFASRSAHIPVVSIKVTGLARTGLLEHIQRSRSLGREELNEYRNALKRVDTICHHATKKGVSVFVDAEESWIQDTIDHFVWLMMKRYNRERVVVYNTFQMYRTDRLQFLLDSFDRSRKEGFLLGAKLVRGAYMEKERERAAKMGYTDPISADKQTVDDHYNAALSFCLEHIEHVALCNASHNAHSARLQIERMRQKKISPQHPHILFSQLFGMSDNLTFNLARAGFRVAKYVPYGQVFEVIPYLIRRAQENTSITGDVSRELALIEQEYRRRKKERAEALQKARS